MMVTIRKGGLAAKVGFPFLIQMVMMMIVVMMGMVVVMMVTIRKGDWAPRLDFLFSFSFFY